MTRGGRAVLASVVCLSAVALTTVSPTPASASLLGKTCGLIGGVAGKACDLASSPGKILGAGKNLLSGHVGSALKDLAGGAGSAASTASTKLAITAVVAWVTFGAKFALDETAKVLTQTTRPNLKGTWFSSAYWRMAGIAALLTVPFLFAAALQALLRSDLALLARATLGYLPLAMLAVSIAAPVAMLLLAMTDQLCGLVSSPGAGGAARFLGSAGSVFAGAHFLEQPFIKFLLGAITAGGALVLWLELAVREAAVYVIVLMLPLAFAALVWPARRVWAIRSVELLVALILSKFAIVAVLGLAGAALGQTSHGGLATALAGTVLVLLAAFAPWTLLRLLPMSELAAGAAAGLRPELDRALHHGVRQDRSLAERPPEQRTESLGPTSADLERERLHDQQDAAAGPQRSDASNAEGGPQRPGATLAAGRRAEAPNHDYERTMPTTSDGRPGVLAPPGGPREPSVDNGDPPDPPPMTLARESFGENGWVGPARDLTSGKPGTHASGDPNEQPSDEPGEDHNPLPPPQGGDAL